MSRTTIFSVAAEAGVSKSTVSAVISGSADALGICVATREKVQRAISSLGYRPDASARAMRMKRHNAIGLILSSRPGESLFTEPCHLGIQERLAAENMHLVVGILPDTKLTSEDCFPKIVREWCTDGLLLDYISHPPEEMLHLIEKHRIPCVWMNRKSAYDCVYPNDFEGGFEAVRHLQGLGHRKIAYMSYSRSYHYSYEDRLQGYRAAMAHFHLAPDLVFREITPEDFLRASVEVLQAPSRPSAIITYGWECEAVILAAMKLGIEIPTQLSVVSFEVLHKTVGGIEVSAMRIPLRQVGEESTRMLMAKLHGARQKQRSIAIPYACPDGRTCAAVRSTAAGSTTARSHRRGL